MAPPDRDLLRDLADWPVDGHPVTSLYLDVDGRRYPRRADVERHGELLLRKAATEAERQGRDAHRAVSRDVERMKAYLADRFDRKGTRGLALFSCDPAGLWQDVPVTQPLRDRATVGPRPYLLPLEAMVERAETFCLALVDREKARLLVGSLGEIEEVTSVLDDVPGQHDQGGWAQARLQRHIEYHVQRHLKHVSAALLDLLRRRPFDRLVLSGPDEVVAELERNLHDYVARRVSDRASLPVTAAPGAVLDLMLALEERVERERERVTVERLEAETAGRTGRGVAGLDRTLEALAQGRIEILVVSAALEAQGVRCGSCGTLASAGARCSVCGSATEPAPDLVEEAVESALRMGCRVETVPETTPGAETLQRLGGMGALLRF